MNLLIVGIIVVVCVVAGILIARKNRHGIENVIDTAEKVREDLSKKE